MQDPSAFKVAHASDSAAYAELDQLKKLQQFNPLPFRIVDGVTEPVMKLGDAFGSNGAQVEQAIVKAGQIVFHSAGDTGATSVKPALKDEYSVVEKLLADFDEKNPAEVCRQFFYHLGDVVYSFGEHNYYYDQFYDAFRNYPAPIFAIPGNHDGLVAPVAPAAGVAGNPAPGDSEAFAFGLLCQLLHNWIPAQRRCGEHLAHHDDSKSGVYYTLDAPLVRIMGIYSNMLENPG